MKNPLVSVVIPTFNMHQSIPATIESVLGQTYKHIEVIVVDDGSTDATRSSIDKYIDSQKIRYCYQKNAGVSAARNKGIDIAQGDYIAFLDSDDIWLVNKVAEQIAALRESPEIRAITCGHIEDFVSQSRRQYEKVTKNFPNREKLFNALSISQILPGSSSGMMVHKSCLEEVGDFDSSLAVGEDWDMWIRIAQNNHIFIVEKPLVIIKRGAANKPDDRTLANEVSDVAKVIMKSVPPEYRKKAFAALFARIGRSCLSSRCIGESVRYLLRSLYLRPISIYPIDILDAYKFPKVPRYYLLLKCVFLVFGVSKNG